MIAQSQLEKLEYSLVESNWRVKRGEIDIIATKNKTLIFVEVKSGLYSKNHLRDYSPLDRLDEAKKIKLLRLGDQYKYKRSLIIKRTNIKKFRFDAFNVEFIFGEGVKIEHVIDIFKHLPISKI